MFECCFFEQNYSSIVVLLLKKAAYRPLVLSTQYCISPSWIANCNLYGKDSSWSHLWNDKCVVVAA
jgi:hypothetical protein